MRYISNWLRRVSNARVTLACLVIFLLFTVLVLPAQVARARAESSGVSAPDLSWYYTADDLYQMAQGYGEAGRDAYIKARFSFDLAWPLVYVAFLATAISWLFQKILAPGSHWALVNLLPLGGGLFDLLENLSTSLVMWRYPASTPVLGSLAGVFTMVKWLLVAASFILLTSGIIAWQSIKAIARGDRVRR